MGIGDFAKYELKETFEVASRDFASAGAASSKIKRILQQIGVDQGTIRRVAVSSYEAEMNVVIHADSGGQMVLEVELGCVRITVQDTGKGIPDIKKAMQPGFSTASDEVREMGFGAGMGLPNMQACADELEVISEPGVGTTVRMIFNNR